MQSRSSRFQGLHVLAIIGLSAVALFVALFLNVGCTPSATEAPPVVDGPALTKGEVIAEISSITKGSGCATQKHGRT